ncbi:MAG: hypothetical protein O7J95_15350 [Planctomycetota bacterium]|nr:hypothetical protein [Planctomycetota bacterium]
MSPRVHRQRSERRRIWLPAAILGVLLFGGILVVLLRGARGGKDIPGSPESPEVTDSVAGGEIEPPARSATASSSSEVELPAEPVAGGVLDVTLDSETLIPAADIPREITVPVPGESEPRDGRFGGGVFDVMSGVRVRGARVRATYFHATGTPEGDLLSIAGTPALHVDDVRAGENGTFQLELHAPEDPLLLLHLQVEHPRYAPRVGVFHGRDGADGLWQEVLVPESFPRSILSLATDGPGGPRQDVEVYLRPSLTIPLRIVDREGRPLAGAAVRIQPHEEGYAFLDEPAVTLGVSGRLVKRDAPFVLFTDEQGYMRLPFHDSPYDLELLHPHHFLTHKDPVTRIDRRGRVTVVLPYTGGVLLRAQAGQIVRHQLVDLDGYPVAAAEIEVALDGMTPARLFTDDEGWFEVGVMPRLLGQPALTPSHPRRGVVTVQAVDYLNRSVKVALPSPSTVAFVVPGRPAGQLRLELVTGAPDAPDPVTPRGLVDSLDMIMERIQPDGVVVFRGSLAGREGEATLACRGFRLARLHVPHPGIGESQLDIGHVLLDPGWSREVKLVTANAAVTRGAWLSLSPRDAPFALARYPVPPSGTVRVSGLRPGPYHLAVEGPWVRPYSGEMNVHVSVLDEPLEIPVEWTDVEEVRVSGRVVEIDPYDAVRASVVERFVIRGRSEPREFPPYPLAADGTLGSIRHLRGVRGVEVAVIARDDWAAIASLKRPEEGPVFELGELRLGRKPSVEVRFTVEALGTVAPPLNVSLEGHDGVEAVSRLRLLAGRLLVDNVRRGPYTLRWLTAAGAEETFGFEVPAQLGVRLQETAVRSPLAEETVEIEVVDSDGQPVEGARAVPAGSLLGRPGELPANGRVFVRVAPAKPTGFQVTAEGYLDARVKVEPGEAIPTQVPLYRGAHVRGKVLDGDGFEAEGLLRISWTPVESGPIEHGEPLEVELQRGRFSASGLPPVALRVRFQLEGSDVAVTRHLFLTETDEPFDVGTLRLEETRSLRGVVWLPDGRPARKARIALVPRDRAYRYPLRDLVDYRRERYTTTTDAEGVFLLEGLPLELSDELVLAARLEGYSDPVEDPLDWELDAHELFLEDEAVLGLDVGYRSGEAVRGYRFTLEYREDLDDPERVFQLGEIVPDLFGLRRFAGVRPGNYRVKWGLRQVYAPLPYLWEDVFLPPAGSARLSLLFEGKTLEGEARLNGAPVEKGWILITYDPGENGGTRVGRIENGRFLMVDPVSTFRAYASIIPEGEPQAEQNVARGEAVPVAVRNYRDAFRQGYLRFDYRAWTLTLRFEPEFLARHPGCVLTFNRYRWQSGRFLKKPAEEPVTEPTVHFHLLEPGVHRIAVRSPRGSLIAGRTVVLKDDDVELRFR